MRQVLRLQVFMAGAWGTLNTRGPVGNEDELSKIEAELIAMQSRWAANYSRFYGAKFRIDRSDK